ncbi:hypothetical protein DRQ29_01380 [bacterium]|nr:MAG: hypothetical protein DRQ29_01380 [bacterium]
MKRFCFVALLVLMLIASAWGAKLSSRLTEKLENISPNQRVDIIVWLNQPDGWAQRRAELEQMTGEARRRYAVQSMKDFYYRHVTSVRDLVSRLAQDGKATFGKDLWGAFSFSAQATKDAIMQISNHPDVKFIMLDEPFPHRFMLPYDPGDPFSKIEWKINNPAPPDISKATMSNAWQITHTYVNNAWSTGYNGDGVIVAIIDTGVDYTHGDLSGVMWHNSGETPGNGVDDDGNGYVDDYYGYDFYDHDSDPMDNPSDIHHGTMCAGMVAGDGTGGWNTGAAPGARIMAIRTGNGSSFCSSSDEIDAFQYAVDNGANVASMSYGSYPSDGVKDYYRYVIDAIFGAAGIPLIVAAGNGNSSGGHYSIPYDISTPADIPPPWYNASVSDPAGPVIAVGATTTSDAVASFSSIGPTEWDFDSYYTSGWHDYPASSRLMKPDVAAPGDNIVTTVYGGGYGYESGTSFACPFTAGVVALLLSKNGELTPRQIDSVLEVSATDIGSTGRDNYSGAGLINADSALSLVSGKALAIDSTKFDDSATGDSDANLDPGETGNVVIYLRNAGSTSMSGVNVTMTSVSNPNVTIVDGSSSYGTMAPGETKVNTSDPITLSISASALYAEDCKCYLTISDGSGYSHPDSIEFRIGIYPGEAIWHDTLATLRIPITNFSIIGYFGGLYWPWPSDSSNNLYIAYPMVGKNTNYIADGGEDFWAFDSIWQYDPGGIADKQTSTSFIDSSNDYQVIQYTYQWRSSPNEDFIIFYYKVFNRTASTISGARCGFYADFDIPPYDTNYAVADDANQWAYTYHSTSGPYAGIVALDGYNLGSVVDNPQYVYGDTFGMGWTDTVKWRFLDGTYNASSGSSAKDWSVILSFGPFDIPVSGFITYCAAIVMGSNLSDFQTNANQAKTIYSSMALHADDNGGKIPEDVALFGAYPNPFNSATKIVYALTEPGNVKLDIIDIDGKIVKTVDSGWRNTKLYSIRSDGCDYSGRTMPSGLYFARLQSEKTLLVKKLMLTK